MSNFIFPKVSIFDTAGDPVSGAKLYFYETSTSTPLETYADQDNTIANTNPIVCDAAGRCGPIWLKVDKVYKLVVKTSTDVTIYTVDPVKAVTVSGGTVASINTFPYVTPFMYAGIGDGVTDDFLSIQNAIDAADRIVDLCGKTWKSNSQLSIPSGITLQNGTIDFSDCDASELIKSSGGSLGSTYVLTSTTEKNSNTATLSSTTGLSKGDFVLLSSSEEIITGITKEAQILRIESIVSSTSVRFDNLIHRQYAIGSGSTIKKINQVFDVCLKNLTLQCGNSATQTGVLLQYCNRAKIENVTISDISRYGINISMCFDSSLDNICIQDMDDENSIAVWISNASSVCKILNTYVSSCKSGVIVGESEYGPSTEVYIKNITSHNTYQYGVGFASCSKNCHLESFIITANVKLSEATNNFQGVAIAGEEITVKNGIVNRASIGISVISNFVGSVAEPEFVNISSVSFNKCKNGIILSAIKNISSIHISDCIYDGTLSFFSIDVQDDTTNVKDVCISNIYANGDTTEYAFFEIHNPEGIVENIYVDNISCKKFNGGFYVENSSKVYIKNCYIQESSGIAINALSTGSEKDTFIVDSCVIPSSGSSGIYIQGNYKNVELKSCTITTSSGPPIYFSLSDTKSMTSLRVIGCLLTGSSSHHGIFISPTNNESVHDVYISGNTFISGRGLLWISKSIGVNVVGNTCQNASASGVAASNTKNICVDDFCVLAGSGAGISISSSDNFKATNLSLYSTGTSIYVEETPNTFISNADTLNSSSEYDINIVNSNDTFISNVKSSCSTKNLNTENSNNVKIQSFYSIAGTKPLTIKNCDSVVVDGCSLKNTSNELMLHVSNSSYISISNCDVQNFTDTGIFIDGSTFSSILSCFVTGNKSTSSKGVKINNSSVIKIIGCNFSKIAKSDISGVGIYYSPGEFDLHLNILSNVFIDNDKGIYVDGIGTGKSIAGIIAKNNFYIGNKDFFQVNANHSSFNCSTIHVECNSVYIKSSSGSLFAFTTTGSMQDLRIRNNTGDGGEFHSFFSGVTQISNAIIYNNYHISSNFTSALGESTSGSISNARAFLNFFHYTGGSIATKGNGSITLESMPSSISGASGASISVDSNKFINFF